MRKNRMMRAASALLVAVLMTTCTISGTFAKYVTEKSASDTARVAKWGVEITSTAANAFAKEYDAGDAADAKDVVAATVTVDDVSVQDKVVAPGTNGTLGGTTIIAGTPEVRVSVSQAATLTLTGWTVDGNEYCPIVFKVGNGDTLYKIDPTNDAMNEISELKAAVEAAAKSSAVFEAGTDLSNVGADTVSVSWEWPFSVDDDKDTALGNLTGENVPKISFTLTTTIAQVGE